jgi:hypothetical protein
MATSDELAQIDISKEVRTSFRAHPPRCGTPAREMFGGLSDPPVLQEKDKLVAEVMRYVLFKTHQNSDCPIKREELTRIVTKNYCQRVLPTLVINEAKDRLAATFGYEMRELQRTRAPATRSGRPSQPQSKASFFSFIFVFLSSVPVITVITGWQ